MTKRAIAYAGLVWVIFAAKVQAGPIELFNGVSVDQTASERLIAPYIWGGSGLFLSADAGKSYRMLCSSWVNPTAQSNGLSVLLQDGAIYVATFDTVWRGDKDGCNFQALPELAHHWISALAADPLDPTRTYAASSDATPAQNGIYLSSARGVFSPIGSQVDAFLNTLTVVKRNGGRRFYATGAKNDPQTNDTAYSVRVSDDDAATWAEYSVPLEQFGSSANATFSIVAIDPQNTDRLVARIARDDMPDTVLYSGAQGMPNSWVVLAEVSTFNAAAFGPDGALYFGDDDQDSPGLFVVDRPGAAVHQLSHDWKVGCLQYDAEHARLYACSDFRFGTADVSTGAFTSAIDMRCAEHFVECPGAQVSPSDMCQDQLLGSYCGPSHYPSAPLCDAYPKDSISLEVAQESGLSCQGGITVPKPTMMDTGSQIEGDSTTAAPLEMPSVQAAPNVTPVHLKSAGCAALPTRDSTTRDPITLLAASALFLIARRKRAV